MNLSHVKKAVRLQLIYGRVTLALPWAVLATSFLINIVIYAALSKSTPVDQRSTGGLASLYGTMLFANMVTVTQVFPFAVSLSMTRRAFATAVTLLVLIEALVSGVILTVLKTLEHATNGWGLELHFFGLPYITQHNPVLQALVFAAPLAAVCFLGVCVGAVFHRWGSLGVWLAGIGVLVVGGLTLAAIIFFDVAHAIGSFVTGQPAFAMLALYPLALAALAAAGASRMLLRSRI